MPTNLYGPGDNFNLGEQPRHPHPAAQGARGRGSLTRIVDYTVELRFDTTKPDGTPRKLLSG